jgi:glucose/mannose transport system permease protein
LIPLIQFLEQIKLYGTIGGLIFVHVVYGLPICSLIFRNFFANIPDELVEAARLDGAGVIRIFLFVMLPLALPAFVVVAIFQFTNIWNDFLFGATFAAGDQAPMTVALNNVVNTSTGIVEYNVNMAAAIIAAAPTLFVYIVAGRYFVRGLMAGAVKG